VHGVHVGPVRVSNIDGAVGDLLVSHWHVHCEEVSGAASVSYGQSGSGGRMTCSMYI